MVGEHWISASARTVTFLALLLGLRALHAQKQISCPDGDHLQIDMEQVSIQYNAASFSATLNGLGSLGARLSIDRQKLQEATASTQQWNEYLKGLVLGYNACAITKQQYRDGIERIYPRIRQDALDLESVRKLLAEGHKANEKKVRSLVESYLSNLNEFKRVTTQRDDLRERALQLYSEICDFLAARQKNDPHPEQAPSFHAASEGGTEKHSTATPSYMRETLNSFSDKYGARLADIHDELSSRGLQSTTLNALYRDPAHNIWGNSDAALREIADSIKTLALLIPPDNLYRNVDNAQLAETSIEEANKLDEMTKDTLKKLESSPVPDAARFFFASEFRDCCLNQVQYLRAELIRRLGPPAYDSDEMRAFNDLAQVGEDPNSAMAVVSFYLPYFRRLAIRLKRKVSPLQPPRALAHFETRTATPGQAGYYRTVVTISTDHDVSSGYVFVKFIGRPAAIGCDVADARPVGSWQELDNSEAEGLLSEYSPTTAVYGLKVGKTPFLTTRPIHVVADALEELRVDEVVLVDE
jgi:hypothetical protein